MPFTFSHPALVIYFPKKWFSITGLVIGSFMPDFEYFIRMSVKSTFSHTILGQFYFCLPLGILLTFLYHNLIRDILFDNLHDFLRSRINKFKSFDWNKYFRSNWLVVISSILIGTFSHIFWDSFTHEGLFFVDNIPYLSKTILNIHIYKILQHTSSLIGLIIIFYFIFKIPKEENIYKNINVKYWFIIGLITFIISTIRIIIGFHYKYVDHTIIIILSAGIISLILTSILFKYKIFKN